MAARKWDTYTGTGPAYEQPADILARTRQFVAQVRGVHAGQHVAVATHGDVVSFLILWIQGLPVVSSQYKRQLAHLDLTGGYPKPASITTLSYHTTRTDEVPEAAYVVPYELG